LFAGSGGADACELTVPASRHLLADERGIPRAVEDVEGTAFDFRQGRSLAGVRLDDCLANLAGSSGSGNGLPEGAAWEAVLRTPEHGAGLWGSPEFAYLMCYTGDTLAVADRRRGVAIEPMTCPPNAFRSGEALWALEPGAARQATWGIRLLV
jgi:aldose 1-epimerase